MIETKRLTLRRLVVTDHGALDLLLGDKDVMASSDHGPLNTNEVGVWLKNQIEAYKKNCGIEILAIEIKPDAQFIGYCGLTSYPDVDGSIEVEIGYRLIQTFWGNGYATEAASVVRDYAFSELNLPRLVALIEPTNTRSIEVAKKLGMKYEKDIMMPGYDHPDHLYSMTR